MPQTPSRYQEAIFSALAETTPTEGVHAPDWNLIVSAVPGSGKSWTARNGCRHIPRGKKIAIIAFGKRIAEEMKLSMPDDLKWVDVRTCHSLGFMAVREMWPHVRVDQYREHKILEKLLPAQTPSEDIAVVADLVSKAKNLLVFGKDDLIGLANDFDITSDRFGVEQMAELAQRVLVKSSEYDGAVSFDDQVWLPVVQNWQVPMKFDVILIDETQDFNKPQLLLAKSTARERIVALGDQMQAIYGFRGADIGSMDRMITELSARQMPLSISYRCPVKVVEMARRYCPQIEAAPGAPEGEITWERPESVLENARPGDFILSRVNAPLFPLCLRLLRERKKARIEGRDVSKSVTSLLRKCPHEDVPGIVEWLEAYREKEVRRLARTRNDRAVDNLHDKVDTIIGMTEGLSTKQDVLSAIAEIFVDDGRPAIVLSSVHRAKGLEANRVWMMEQTFRPGRDQEETNITYVALTRVKHDVDRGEPGKLMFI